MTISHGFPSNDQLVKGLSQGSRRCLAKAISLVDAGVIQTGDISEKANSTHDRGFVIGVTGAPGVGKSTLIDALVAEYRQKGDQIAVIAVDPTSPVTGGSLLGDRIRMQRHAADPGVFIRSIASRGVPDGLSWRIEKIIELISWAGFRTILVETVGTGQEDVDVASYSDLVIYVTTPGLGDEIQVAKAGILEAIDIVVINKSDLDPGGKTAAIWRSGFDKWRKGDNGRKEGIPVLTVSSLDATGITQVVTAIEGYRSSSSQGAGKEKRALFARRMIEKAVAQGITREVMETAEWQGLLPGLIEDVAWHKKDPKAVADALIRAYIDYRTRPYQ